MKIVNKSEFVTARPHAELSSGEVIRMLRELKGWTQEELAERSGVSPTNLSLLENDRVDIGKKRALQIAAAFGVHPATIMFPEYEAAENKKAA
jgi:transcriptional regulator with XRE-family HTH domain